MVPVRLKFASVANWQHSCIRLLIKVLCPYLVSAIRALKLLPMNSRCAPSTVIYAPSRSNLSEIGQLFWSTPMRFGVQSDSRGSCAGILSFCHHDFNIVRSSHSPLVLLCWDTICESKCCQLAPFESIALSATNANSIDGRQNLLNPLLFNT